MKKILFLLPVLLLCISIQAQTIIQNDDGTYQIETIEKRPNGEQITRLSENIDSAMVVSYVYVNLFRAYDREATRIKQLELQENERAKWSKAMNQDLNINYFDRTAAAFAPTFSGEWRVRVDTLKEICNLELTTQGKIRLRGQEAQSVITQDSSRFNVRINIKSEKQLQLKNLLGADVEVFDSDLLNFDAENEEEDEETETQRRRRYVGRHPVTNARIVLLKLKDVENE